MEGRGRSYLSIFVLAILLWLFLCRTVLQCGSGEPDTNYAQKYIRSSMSLSLSIRSGRRERHRTFSE